MSKPPIVMDSPRVDSSRAFLLSPGAGVVAGGVGVLPAAIDAASVTNTANALAAP